MKKQTLNSSPRSNGSARASLRAHFIALRRLMGLQRPPSGEPLKLRVRRLKTPSIPFDLVWYKSQFPKSSLLHGDLRRHYIRWGAQKGLSPHPLFDPAWYLAQLPAPLPEESTAFEHFLQEGGAQGYSPHPLFDSRWYLDENPDVDETGANPLLHFLSSGADEGRKPNFYFDPSWYRHQHIPEGESKLNPLIHYVQVGAPQDLNPSILFDARAYRANHHDIAEAIDRYGGALAHFLAESIQRRQATEPRPSASDTGTHLAIARPRGPKLPIKVLIVSADIDDRSWNRSTMFAIVASRVARDVTLINFQLDRDHGTRPPSDQRKEWPAIDINARNLPELLDTIHNIASVTRPDFVIASLVSLPSLMLGLSLRECSDCRLVLDINKNYTTPHCNSPTEVELERLLSTAYFPQSVDAPRPTPLMETLISEADAITVCDAALQGRFGGLLVPSQDDAVGASIADTDPIVATSLQTIFSHIAPPPADRHNSVSARLVAALRSATTHAPPPPDGADIVVFWKQNDTTLYGRRHDMVIKYLASRTDVRRIVVFDLPISIHDLNKFRDAGTEQASEYRHLYIRTQKKSLEIMDEEKIAYRSFIYHPDIDHSINVTSSSGVSLEGHFYDFVASVLDRENVRTNDAIFWVYPRNPFIEALVDIFRPKRIVVDVVDDHRAWPGVTAEQKAELTEHYRSVLALADFSFANCEPVAAAMRRFSPTIQLIPNGCEIEPIICEPAWSEAFETFKTWQGKIIGYVGNLEEKIDLDLLHKLARTFPDCLIVLVGSTHANPASRNLTRHANVMMPGVLPYNEIGAWVSRFSIGIIPHRIMDLTKSMNPLKLFVYASHGIPVVATDIPNLSREWAGLFVAVDHDDFLYQVRQCLDNPIKPHKSSDFVERNSWKRRLDKVVSKIIR